MASDPTTRDMSDKHERFLQELFGGRITPGSGNGFANQMDVRNNREDPLPLAIDGKSTFGKSIGVTEEMWDKAVEQAGDLTPMLALRWYAKDNTLKPKRDLVVLDANDFAEMVDTLRIAIEQARAREEHVSLTAKSQTMTGDELDDKIQEWHEGAGQGEELHEYLGFTLEEYQEWFKTGMVPKRVRDPRAVER
jgi:hypothetical protein